MCLLGLSRLKWRSASSEPLHRATASPLQTTVGKLSHAEKQGLPYPTDLFPGARDVQSPYGSVRVYEWGPEKGRRVVLVHGISTPCLSLGPLAQFLAENGCRVMLFGTLVLPAFEQKLGDISRAREGLA